MNKNYYVSGISIEWNGKVSETEIRVNELHKIIDVTGESCHHGIVIDLNHQHGWTIKGTDNLTIQNGGNNTNVRALNFSNISVADSCFVWVGCECTVSIGSRTFVSAGVELSVMNSCNGSTITYNGGITFTGQETVLTLLDIDNNTIINTRVITNANCIGDVWEYDDFQGYAPREITVTINGEKRKMKKEVYLNMIKNSKLV